jgi:hypothetical protein
MAVYYKPGWLPGEKIIMKYLSLGGALFFIGALFLLKSKLKDVKVSREGELVEMTILKVPGPCAGTRVNHFARFLYNEKTYTKKVGCPYGDEHRIGEKVNMKMLEDYDIVLFPEENPLTEMAAMAALGLFGIFCIIRGLKR